MKKLLLAIVLFASVAQAQEPFFQNSAQSTKFSTAGAAAKGAVDNKGNIFTRVIDPSSGLSQSVIPVSNATSLSGVGAGQIGWTSINTDLAETGSTATVINATSHVARVGDIIQFYAGASNTNSWSPVTAVAANTITVGNAFPAAPANGDGFYILRPVPLYAGSAVSTGGAGLISVIDSGYRAGSSYATNILKLEDSGHASGDAGVMPLAVNNRNMGTFTTTNLDYVPPAVTDYGSLFSYLIYDDTLGDTRGATTREDVAIAADSAMVKTAAQAVSAIAQTVGTSGDAAPPAMDLGNRTVVTNAPAGETWQGCGTATASTADVAIKAAVASNRIYTTSITCASSDADNATNINFKDGSTVIAVGGVNQMATTSAGTFTATFTTPLRGTSNTALNFNTAVSTSSVICCAAGYISTI